MNQQISSNEAQVLDRLDGKKKDVVRSGDNSRKDFLGCKKIYKKIV